MKLAYALLVIALLGCSSPDTSGYDVLPDDETTTVVDAGTDTEVPSVCGADDVVETVLPAVSDGDVLILCTVCDVGGCLNMGTVCESYGAPCDIGNSRGTCVGCCNGSIGELHCKATS